MEGDPQREGLPETAWESLDPRLRRHLARALDGEGPLARLVAHVERPSPVAALAAFLFGTLGLLLVARQGFGHPDGARALQPPLFAAFYAGLAVMAVAGLGLLRRTFRRGDAPAAGRYLLPCDLVEVSGDGVVTVLPLGPVPDVRVVPREGPDVVVAVADVGVGTADGTRTLLPVGDPARARAIAVSIREAAVRLAEALARDDAAALEGLLAVPPSLGYVSDDPAEGAGPYRSAPTRRAVTPASPWLIRTLRRVLPTVVTGALLGPALWAARNQLSDERSYELARQGDVLALERYAAGGGAHANEVVEDLVPAARLAWARGVGSVGSYREVIARHPGTPMAGEAERAIEERYAVGHARVDEAVSDVGLRRFLHAALRHAEEHGPRVEVRFGAPDVSEVTDGAIDGLAPFGVTPGDLSRWARPDRVERDGRALTEQLRGVLVEVLPNELLRLEHAGLLPAVGASPYPLTVEVRTAIAPSGTVYVPTGEVRPTGAGYAGVRVDFDLRFLAPAAEHRTSVSVEPPEELVVRTIPVLELGRHRGVMVYDQLLEHAFASLGDTLRGAFRP